MTKVLLTGISGYVAQHCALELLQCGYSVKGSLRSLNRSDVLTKAIQNKVDSKGRLEFCELDLLEDDGWDEAMEGCSYVLHVASPYSIKVPKDENKLIRPAVEGTKRVLLAAKKAGIKRVVLTSSIVAMLGNVDESLTFNQNTWTNTKAKNASAYIKSKTLAEKCAWDFINKQEDGGLRLELVAINPGSIYGPTLTGNLSGESMNMVKKMISGKLPMLPKGGLSISDVRDVAKIHVQALTNPHANGKRFIVTSEKAHSFLELAHILKHNGYNKVSTLVAPNFLIKFLSYFNNEIKGTLPFTGNTYSGDINQTIKRFNWKPRPLKQTLLETAKSVERAMKKEILK